jgi:hypothetical protein
LPTRLILVSTATGTFGPVDYGDAYRSVGYAGPSTADKDYAGTIQGSVGGGNAWQTIITLTTANSTGPLNSTGTDRVVFDKLRMVLTKNNSTHATPVWLAASF